MQRHEEWLWVANEDLRAAKKLIDDEEAIILPAFFHTQQCAEKALKAYLVFQQQPIQRIHSLPTLVKKCMFFDAEFSTLLETAVDLNPYLSESRYPDAALVFPDIMSLKISIQQAESVLNFVKEKIAGMR